MRLNGLKRRLNSWFDSCMGNVLFWLFCALFSLVGGFFGIGYFSSGMDFNIFLEFKTLIYIFAGSITFWGGIVLRRVLDNWDEDRDLERKMRLHNLDPEKLRSSESPTPTDQSNNADNKQTLPCDAEVTSSVPDAIHDWFSELAELQNVTPRDIVLDALQVGLPTVTEKIRKAAELRPQPYGHTKEAHKRSAAKIEAVNEIEAKANARLRAAQFES